MIYCINQNNKMGIGFTEGNSGEVILKPCSDNTKEGLKIHFVSEFEKVNTASHSEPKASSSKAPKLQILKRSEPNKQVLKKTESKTQKPRFQRKEAVVAKLNSKTKGSEPKVWKKTKQDNFRQRTQRKFKTPRTNPRGPTKIWVPKSDIVDVAGMSKRKRKAEVLVPGQWLLATHDGRKVYVPNPDHERGRNCEIWRKPNWQNIGTGTIGNSSISINNVWLVDELRHNLLSISQFCDNGYDVMFEKNNCTVINKDDQSIIFKGKRRNNVYKINFSELTDQKVLCLL